MQLSRVVKMTWRWVRVCPGWTGPVVLGVAAASAAHFTMPSVPSTTVPIHWTPALAFEFDRIYAFVLPGWFLAEAFWDRMIWTRMHYEQIMFIGNAATYTLLAAGFAGLGRCLPRVGKGSEHRRASP